MNEPRNDNRTAALQEASEWLLRLQEAELSSEDIEAWSAWMEASPAHSQAFDDISVIWEASGDLDSDDVLRARAAATSVATPPAAHAPRAPAPARRAAPRNRRRWGFGTAIAAACAGILFTIAVVRLPSPHPAQSADETRLITVIGEQRHIRLADGSTVDLGPASELLVHYRSSRRQLELLKGEAYFTVAKDPARPFEVRAAGAMAQALGTRFSVEYRGDQVAVSVTEGHVQLNDLSARERSPTDATVSAPLQLGPDQRAVLVPGRGLVGPVATDARNAVAWLDGIMIYRSEPLANVIDDLNRYSPMPIRLQGNSLSQLPVTGRWQTQDVDAWLNGLAHALSLTIKRTPDHILLAPDTANAKPDPQSSTADEPRRGTPAK